MNVYIALAGIAQHSDTNFLVSFSKSTQLELHSLTMQQYFSTFLTLAVTFKFQLECCEVVHTVAVMTSHKLAHTYFLSVAMELVRALCAYMCILHSQNISMHNIRDLFDQNMWDQLAGVTLIQDNVQNGQCSWHIYIIAKIQRRNSNNAAKIIGIFCMHNVKVCDANSRVWHYFRDVCAMCSLKVKSDFCSILYEDLWSSAT